MLVSSSGGMAHLDPPPSCRKRSSLMLILGIIVVALVVFGLFWQRGRAAR